MVAESLSKSDPAPAKKSTKKDHDEDERDYEDESDYEDEGPDDRQDDGDHETSEDSEKKS